MAVQLEIDLPSFVEERLRQEDLDVASDVRITYLLELYRRGILSQDELAAILQLDRFETLALLKQHEIFEGALTDDDLAADRESLERLL